MHKHQGPKGTGALAIPEEAVEAAARTSYSFRPATNYFDDSSVTWDQLSDSGSGAQRKERELNQARAALEAAAPFIAAAAFQRGYVAAMEEAAK